MLFEAQFHSGNPIMVEYTPSQAVSAGQVIVTNDTVRIAHRDIAANELGALAAGDGLYWVKCLDPGGIQADRVIGWNNTFKGVTNLETASDYAFGVTVTACTAEGQLILVRHDTSKTTAG